MMDMKIPVDQYHILYQGCEIAPQYVVTVAPTVGTILKIVLAGFALGIMFRASVIPWIVEQIEKRLKIGGF